MSRDRKCTLSTRNGHAHAYRARRVNMHWHVIIFRQLSWYGVPARQNRNRREEKMKTEVWPEMSPSTVFPPFCVASLLAVSVIREHVKFVPTRTTSIILSQRVSLQLAGGHREHILMITWSRLRWGGASLFAKNKCILTSLTTRSNWHKKKEAESSPKSTVIHAHHSHVNDYCCSRRAECAK